jgi:hypothetical protein
MANEFIARKGLIVLSNGAKITGSFGVSSDSIFNGPVTASAGATGSFTGSFKGDGSQLTGLVTDLRISGSTGSDTVNLLTDTLSVLGSNGVTTVVTDNTLTVGIPAGTVSASSQVDVRNTTGISTIATTGSNIFTSNQIISGNLTFANDGQIRIVDNTDSTLFGFFDGTNILGAYYQMWGNNHASTNQRGSAEFVFDTRNSGGGFRIASFDGSTFVSRLEVNRDGNTIITGSLTTTGGITGSILSNNGVVSSSAQVDIQQTTNYTTFSSSLATVDQNQQAQINALIGITGSYATTGSNTFTGIQTINNTTNSTNYTDGALVVHGGVGIEKDVNISGSLNVTGLLTATSMSVQYVTSSQYVVGTSRIILNDDDLVRFAGISVIDSGSTYGTGSLLWDSLHNHWIYQADDQAYNSAILIAGPKNTGSLGDEVGLTTGRIPVAAGGDHIDTNPSLTPLRIDGGVFHVEGSQYVTGSVTASAFSGDGSNLTGIVTNLNITGSDGGTGTVSLKTQALTIDGTNGLTATVSGQTITISGSNATTSARGVASFTGSNFTVTSGEVSSNPINFNGANINLGGTHSFGLQNITPYGASTTDQVSFNGGAVIHGVLFTSGSNSDVDTGTEVVATIATGSRDAAFFDYVVKNGVNYRAGTVMAVWDGANNVEFTDTSTNDLGNTADVVFAVDALSGNARLKATVASDNWIVKTAVRAL